MSKEETPEPKLETFAEIKKAILKNCADIAEIKDETTINNESLTKIKEDLQDIYKLLKDKSKSTSKKGSN